MVDPDEALVQRYLRGDQKAFRSLVERHTPAVYNLAYRSTYSSDDAADITQETFRRVVEALPGSRLDLPFKPWVLRIALNLCRDLAKKKQPVVFASLAFDASGEDDDDVAEALPDLSPLPADILEADETRLALERALQGLSDGYRTVIMLRYAEDLSYQEIAATLNLPLNTVRTHLARAKKALHERLRLELGEKS
ncbi:MAG: sigma-70 family RNA polymerase sigma factor [Anaerolineae bacterium]